MTPAQLSRIVLRTVRRAVEADELRVAVPERVVVQSPPRPGCGDYATNVALRLAGGARGDGLAPRAVAEVLRRRLVREPGIRGVDIAGPGFLNITLSGDSHARLVELIREQGADYGRNQGLDGHRLRITHDGRARATVVGEAVCRLALASGARVDDPAEDGGGDIVMCDAVMGDVGVDSSAVGESAAGAFAMSGSPDDPHPLRVHRVHVRDVESPLHQLLPLLGEDALRWALLRPAPHDLPDLDPARLLAQRESNPLFRVRYAHSRTRALLRNGRDLGVEPLAGDYEHPAETGLAQALADFPRIVEAAARDREPDRVARYLEAVADACFRCHDACPALPCGEQKPLAVHRSRLALADAAGTVLANGLHLLGISAPAHL
ncbi:arginine--tRNA ligase [Streptomyces sp. LX-29]|uniref:ArgS-related anticodon-binding protein NrtL n=1 Tax=Streptomyces sp. LX-29 TaxID=2900152 RepID=UPI00240DEE37|nr:DALR anticodon-binding domain-containing protein [Streptomyces sp. LX-29]WFB07387.1 arginine--tRNA ligase [Streptomyces sp. LX-29]